MAAPKTTKGPSIPGQIYLFIYNFLQVLGWSNVLLQTVNYYLNLGDGKAAWEMVNPALIIFQTAAALEVVNVAVGLVKTSLVTTIFQVLSRVFIVGVLYLHPGTRTSTGVALLLFAWSVTEIVRYSYYAFAIVNFTPSFLSWARYTLFYALYPIGVTGEVLVVLSSITFAEESPINITLPNAWNTTLCYEYLMYLVLLSYLLLFPRMFLHMVHQRRKVLGRALFDSDVKKTK